MKAVLFLFISMIINYQASANMMIDEKHRSYLESRPIDLVHHYITKRLLKTVKPQNESILDNSVVEHSTCAVSHMDRNTALNTEKAKDEDDETIIRSVALEFIGCALGSQFSSYNKNLIITPQVSYYTQGVRVEYHF